MKQVFQFESAYNKSLQKLITRKQLKYTNNNVRIHFHFKPTINAQKQAFQKDDTISLKMHQQFLTYLNIVYVIFIENQKDEKTIICYLGDPADDPLPSFDANF